MALNYTRELELEIDADNPIEDVYENSRKLLQKAIDAPIEVEEAVLEGDEKPGWLKKPDDYDEVKALEEKSDVDSDEGAPLLDEDDDEQAGQDDQYQVALKALLTKVMEDATKLAAPLLLKLAELRAKEEKGLNDAEEAELESIQESLLLLAHVFYHCKVLHSPHLYPDELVEESKQQLAVLSQLAEGHASVHWQRFGKFLGVVAVVAVMGVLAVTPVGGVSLVVFLAGLVAKSAAVAIAAALAPVVLSPVGAGIVGGVSAGVGVSGIFANRKGKQLSGLAKSTADVQKITEDVEGNDLSDGDASFVSGASSVDSKKTR